MLGSSCLRRDERGQGATKYLLMFAAVLVIAAIAVYYIVISENKPIGDRQYKIGNVVDARISTINRERAEYATLIQFIFDDNTTLTLIDANDVYGGSITFGENYLIIYQEWSNGEFRLIDFWRLDA